MKCTNCGTEYEGNFCPSCGQKTITETPYYDNEKSKPKRTKNKKKKPFFLRWWFILLVIIVVIIGANAIKDMGEKIKWEEICLGYLIPEPPEDRGEIFNNSDEILHIDVNKISNKEYIDYMTSCKNMGFIIDEDKSENSYEAYNEDGYSLKLYYYSSNEELSITLEEPIQMTEIVWPTSQAGKKLPKPKSTIGKFSFEHDDNFSVTIGNTTKSDFKEYVSSCSEKGFNVDFDKGDNYYYAYNTEGWHISLDYKGNNIMSITVRPPDENSEEIITNTTTTTTSSKEETKESSNSNKLDPDFKAAMDSYEKFMDEYVYFMKKYAESDGTDLSIFTDYADYMSKYADFVEDFEKWEEEDLNAVETAYYIDVQARVTKKLLEIS